MDVGNALESLFAAVDFDIVHVHDPFAPSLSSAALRQSWTLNVGSFHLPTERVLSTQVARPLVEIFFGRLDARIVSGRSTRELLERFFPGGYDVVEPAAEVPAAASSSDDGPPRIIYCAREERGALRLFIRALRRLPLDQPWVADVWLEGDIPTPRINRQLRERVRFLRPGKATPEELIAAADVVCATSGGPRPAPSIVRDALAAGAVPVAAQIAPYAELLDGDGLERGFLFLHRVIPRRSPVRSRGSFCNERMRPAWRRRGAARSARGRTSATTSRRSTRGRRLVARRHDPEGKPAIRRRLAKRGFIHCDLHMHTDHSPDCATPVEVLLETAKARGLGAIAITDHNEVSGALEAREMAERIGGIKVIVAEEVKTAEQGEVIGLFIEEKIERGMTMAETIAEIRRQGGLVYVPHPFDRLHSVPDYEHLLDIVEEIDIIEVFNPRVAFSAFNEEAERFASKYRIVPGAGSDGHVAQALGSVRIRLHDFQGPEEFLEAMRSADIVRKHKNLVYVQALKWMQAASGKSGGRKQVDDPRPVRGGMRAETRRRRAAGAGGRGKS